MKIQFKNVVELAEWCNTNTDTVKRITSDEEAFRELLFQTTITDAYHGVNRIDNKEFGGFTVIISSPCKSEIDIEHQKVLDEFEETIAGYADYEDYTNNYGDEIRIYHYMITYEYTLIIATIIEKGKI